MTHVLSVSLLDWGQTVVRRGGDTPKRLWNPPSVVILVIVVMLIVAFNDFENQILCHFSIIQSTSVVEAVEVLVVTTIY